MADKSRLLGIKNKVSHPPGCEIEAIAKMILPDMVAFFSTEEGRKEYEEWLAERRTKYSKDSEEKGKLRKDGTQTA